MGFLDLFRPKWKNSDASIRIKAVQELNDEAILAQLALSDEDNLVRCHAIEKIVDRNILTQIVSTYLFGIVSETAAKRIKDLIKARLLAVKEITDQDSLIKIVLGDEDFNVRRIAVEKIKDPEALIKIALGDEDSSVRRIATKKITDQDTLIKIALGDGDWHVRKEAAEKITSQDALIKIALEDDYNSIREVAIEKLENQNILTRIAIENFNEEIALLATKKINIQSSFSKIALQAETNLAREFAASLVTDELVKGKLALLNSNYSTQEQIIQTIFDEFILAQIIQTSVQLTKNLKHAKEHSPINGAYYKCKHQESELIEKVKNLTDINELSEIAQNHILINVRIEAVLKINDQDILTQIAKNEIVYEVRVSAIKKLTNLYTLSAIAITEWDIPMRRQLSKIVFEQLTFLDKIEETEEINTLILKGLGMASESLTTQESFLPYLLRSSNPEVFDKAFKWLLNTYFTLSQSTIALLNDCFPDYLNILIDLRTYKRHIEFREEGWSTDNGGPWNNEYHTYDKKLMEQATERLCKLKTPVSSNLLHLITKRKSISISLGMNCNFKSSNGTLNWIVQKKIALNELKTREYPNYDPKLYLKPKAWQIK